MASYDVVVLGGGSAGEAVARALAGKRSVAIVEDRLVGGECPYLACMPSKALLKAAARRVSWPEAVAFRDDVADHRDDSEVVDDLEQQGIEVIRGRGRVTGPGRLEVGGQEVEWRDLVVTTGAAPIIPPIEGLDGIDAWTSDDALASDELPRRLAIIGGGPIGCELAQVYARFGSTVTVVEASQRLVEKEPEFVGALLRQVLESDGVDLRTGTQAERVQRTDSGLRLHLSDGSLVDADRVLVATGKKPRTEGLGLDALGIAPGEKGELVVDDACRVADHVWAAGDVTAVAPYTHTANYQAKVLAENLLGGRRSADYRAIPRAVYTDPPAAAVGTTPVDRDDLAVAVMDLSQTARALVEGPGVLGDERSSGGRLELYADPDTATLVGAAAVGPGADEWLAEASVAVRAQVPLAVLADVVHAFPTWGEALEPPYTELARRLSDRKDH